jgi:hypothetical protein
MLPEETPPPPSPSTAPLETEAPGEPLAIASHSHVSAAELSPNDWLLSRQTHYSNAKLLITTPVGCCLLCLLASPLKILLPPSLNISIPSIQTQEITVLVKDIYTLHFTLSYNSPPTRQLLYFCLYP